MRIASGTLVASGLSAAGCECSGDHVGSALPEGEAGLADTGGGREASPIRVDAHTPSPETGIDLVPEAGRTTDGAPIDGPNPPDASAPRDAHAEASAIDSAMDAGGRVTDVLPPVSVFCGDSLRGPTEECDDGNLDDTDFCTVLCRIIDRPALEDPTPIPLPRNRRSIAQGGHVAAAGATGAAVLFVDESVDPQELGVAVFHNDGTRALGATGVNFSGADRPYDPIDASVVALPNDVYAVTWTAINGDGEGLGVVLRSVNGATGALSSRQIVNTSTFGNQQRVDAVWTGSELVVAWTELASPTRPSVRYRRYSASLQPLGGEETLEPTRVTSLPALAPFDGSFAISWIERDGSSNPTYHVRAGAIDWQVGGFYATTGDLPRLVELDENHLLITVVAPVWDAVLAIETPRLSGAVLDTALPGPVSAFAIEPLHAGFTEPTRSQHQPAIAAAGGSAFVSWLTGTGQGVLGQGLFLKEMPWSGGTSASLDLSREERPIARDPARQGYGQERPALVSWPRPGADTLFAAWEDGQKSFGGNERRPDVVVQLLPLPLTRLGEVPHDL